MGRISMDVLRMLQIMPDQTICPCDKMSTLMNERRTVDAIYINLNTAYNIVLYHVHTCKLGHDSLANKQSEDNNLVE